MIVLRRALLGMGEPDCLTFHPEPWSTLECWRAIKITEALNEGDVLPLAKLPQVIAVLRLNGIEVELGEGL